jgi:hypothetical protein
MKAAGQSACQRGDKQFKYYLPAFEITRVSDYLHLPADLLPC